MRSNNVLENAENRLKLKGASTKMKIKIERLLTLDNFEKYSHMGRIQRLVLSIIASIDQNFISFLLGIIAAITIEYIIGILNMAILPDLLFFFLQLAITIFWITACYAATRFTVLFFSIQNAFTSVKNQNDLASKLNRFFEHYDEIQIDYKKLTSHFIISLVFLLLSINAMFLKFTLMNIGF